ncbi:MAG: GntR family transcriptional regulator [Bacillota bacterium]|nr:GntR family transcriptional regulator [Bacillota bacterium]
MGALPKIGSKVSLAERAYESIKNAILMNHFKPGDILSEEKLAEELLISRTPVRSALKALAFDHLVVLNPSKNIVVSDVSKEDIEDITVARVPLEAVAVTLAAAKADMDGLDNLKETLIVQKKAVAMKDYELFIKMDYDFHVSIARLSNNKWLDEMVTRVNTIVHRYLILSGSMRDYTAEALTEHEKILRAIGNSDIQKAEAMMRQHLNRSL